MFPSRAFIIALWQSTVSSIIVHTIAMYYYLNVFTPLFAHFTQAALTFLPALTLLSNFLSVILKLGVLICILTTFSITYRVDCHLVYHPRPCKCHVGPRWAPTIACQWGWWDLCHLLNSWDLHLLGWCIQAILSFRWDFAYHSCLHTFLC